MSAFDIALVVIIALFGLFGFFSGFIATLGSLLGTVLGAYLAVRFYGPMADWLMGITGWSGNPTKVLMFIVAFILINRLVGFVFWFLEKMFKVFTFLPFISTINRLLGCIFGIAEGLVTIGLILYFVKEHPLSDKLMDLIANSTVAPYSITAATIFLPLVPILVKYTKDAVDYVQKVVK